MAVLLGCLPVKRVNSQLRTAFLTLRSAVGTVKNLPDCQNFVHSNQFGSLFVFYFSFFVNGYDIGHGCPLSRYHEKLKNIIPSGLGGVNLLAGALWG
jgi:hypothetical protein